MTGRLRHLGLHRAVSAAAHGASLRWIGGGRATRSAGRAGQRAHAALVDARARWPSSPWAPPPGRSSRSARSGCMPRSRSCRSRSASRRRCSASRAGSAWTTRCASASQLPPDRELRIVALSVAVIAVIAGGVAIVTVFTARPRGQAGGGASASSSAVCTRSSAAAVPAPWRKRGQAYFVARPRSQPIRAAEQQPAAADREDALAREDREQRARGRGCATTRRARSASSMPSRRFSRRSDETGSSVLAERRIEEHVLPVLGEAPVRIDASP